MLYHNELLFIVHASIISAFSLMALKMGKEALVSFISVACILANLFVIKQTMLCGLTATCADAFSIGAVLGLNLLQEYYGREIVKKAIWISFGSLLLYVVVSQIHLMYIPIVSDTTHTAYSMILSAMPRIVIASFFVYLTVQYIDAWLYGYLKQKFHNNYLVVRNCMSIGLCQLLDTILFSFLGLYGIVHNVWSIILVSYAIKLLALIIAIPFIKLSKRVMAQ